MKITIKIILVFLIMWPFYAESQKLGPSSFGRTKDIETKLCRGNEVASQKQYSTEQNPLIVKVLPSPKSKEEANHETYDRHEKSTNETRLVWVTIWLAFVTTILAIFTGYLWNATRRMVRSTEETAKRQLRAFIFGKGFNQGTNTWDDKIKEYVFWVTWENVGLTPGLDVCSWINFKTAPTNEKQPIIFASTERNPVVMGPHATAQTGFITIPLETMMQRWRNEIIILVWSRVEYQDIFDSKIVHHHEQCARIDLLHDPSFIPPPGHPPYVTFTAYGNQNSTG
jgi:hypothetical protein